MKSVSEIVYKPAVYIMPAKFSYLMAEAKIQRFSEDSHKPELLENLPKYISSLAHVRTLSAMVVSLGSELGLAVLSKQHPGVSQALADLRCLTWPLTAYFLYDLVSINRFLNKLDKNKE